MESAYHVKALGEIIAEEAKKEGLSLAEEAVEKLGKAAYVGFKRWVSESATMSENRVDDMLAPAAAFLDPIVLPQIEKLDLDSDGK